VTDADLIKVLIVILMAMVGAFYASFLYESFLYESRRMRADIHKMRNILTRHQFRLIALERYAGFREYDEGEEER